MHHSPKGVKQVKSLRLARQAQGTLEKVFSMIESGVYCPEVIQQLDSAVGLLNSVRRELVAGHLDTCALEKLKQNKKKAIVELLKIYRLC